jgi:uncharacterized protein YjbJ (UPF0337 family)
MGTNKAQLKRASEDAVRNAKDPFGSMASDRKPEVFGDIQKRIGKVLTKTSKSQLVTVKT